MILGKPLAASAIGSPLRAQLIRAMAANGFVRVSAARLDAPLSARLVAGKHSRGRNQGQVPSMPSISMGAEPINRMSDSRSIIFGVVPEAMSA